MLVVGNCEVVRNSASHNFQHVFFSNNINLEVVNEMKLVGVILSSDLKWEEKKTIYLWKSHAEDVDSEMHENLQFEY